MHKWLIMLAVVLGMACGVVGDQATHRVPDLKRQLQVWLGDQGRGYVVSGCLPSVPGSGLTLAAFACEAYTRDTTTGELLWMGQASAAVGPLNSGNGTYWLAVHRDLSTSVSGWTRQAGTQYLWRLSSSQPAAVSGLLLIAEVEVSGGNITTVGDRRPSSPRPGPVHNVTDPLYGAVGDGNGTLSVGTDNTTALQAAIDAAIETRGIVYVPAPSIPGGCYRVVSALTIASAAGMQMVGANRQTARICSEVAAGTYALTVRNSQQVKISNVGILLTNGGNGLRFDRTSGTNLYNYYSGQIECTSRAGALPAIGAGTVGVLFSGSTSNYFNVLEHPYVNKCDNGVYMQDANNAQEVINPQIENYWRGILVQSDENKIRGGFCHQGAGAGGNATQCLVLGTSGNAALFNQVSGLVCEPGTLSQCLNMDSASGNNYVQMGDNGDQSNSHPTTSNAVVLRQSHYFHALQAVTATATTSVSSPAWTTTSPVTKVVADNATGTVTFTTASTNIWQVLIQVHCATGGTLGAYRIAGATKSSGGAGGGCLVEEIYNAFSGAAACQINSNNFSCASSSNYVLTLSYANDEASNTEEHTLYIYPIGATNTVTITP